MSRHDGSQSHDNISKIVVRKEYKNIQKPRAPSEYNIFMKKEIKKLKISHPDLDHKVRFKMAAGNWSKCKGGCGHVTDSDATDNESGETDDDSDATDNESGETDDDSDATDNDSGETDK